MTTPNHSIIDRLRIAWLSARYDLWLDLASVPRRDRRDLRSELVANVNDAAAVVGVPSAIANIGSVRRLAKQTALDGELRSAWTAAITAGFSTLVGLTIGFFFLSLYYIDGALDAGSNEVVSSWLFPFFGSMVEVEPATTDGLGFSVSPGPLPFIAGIIVFVVVAKPWRAIRRDQAKRPVEAR